jgi:hypothetical protein
MAGKRNSLNEIMSGLAPSLPPGIHITGIEAVSQDEPALQTQVKSAEYRITCLDPNPDLGKIVDELLASDALLRERRGKKYDLRPFIEAMQVITEPGQEGQCHRELAAREMPRTPGRWLRWVSPRQCTLPPHEAAVSNIFLKLPM